MSAPAYSLMPWMSPGTLSSTAKAFFHHRELSEATDHLLASLDAVVRGETLTESLGDELCLTHESFAGLVMALQEGWYEELCES